MRKKMSTMEPCIPGSRLSTSAHSCIVCVPKPKDSGLPQARCLKLHSPEVLGEAWEMGPLSPHCSCPSRWKPTWNDPIQMILHTWSQTHNPHIWSETQKAYTEPTHKIPHIWSNTHNLHAGSHTYDPICVIPYKKAHTYGYYINI